MATRRTQQLAQPKPDRLKHRDRRSVYWLDQLPPEKTHHPTSFELTPRWLELSRSKKFFTNVSRCPDWPVSEASLRAVPSQRLCRLAEPRGPAAGWQPERPLLARMQLQLNRETQTVVASARLCHLARPKKRPATGDPGQKPRPVPMSHLPCKASAHIELLSTPKPDHSKLGGERSVYWPVSRAARSYVASLRLLELSVPKERRGLFEGYDPFAVSRGARSASASARIHELSLPLPRKCSAKSERSM